MRLDKLRRHDQFPSHEDARADDRQLEILQSTTREPSAMHTFYIAHTTNGTSRADDERMLAWLKRLDEHVGAPRDMSLWIWSARFSTPTRNAEGYEDAMGSTLCYSQVPPARASLVSLAKHHAFSVLLAQLCGHVVPLVRDPSQHLITGGWDRLQVVVALTPKRHAFGAWRSGPLNLRYRYYSTNEGDDRAGLGPRLTAADLRNPRAGAFVDDEDRAIALELLSWAALRFGQYVQDRSSSAWDVTIKPSDVPSWLVQAAATPEAGRRYQVSPLPADMPPDVSELRQAMQRGQVASAREAIQAGHADLAELRAEGLIEGARGREPQATTLFTISMCLVAHRTERRRPECRRAGGGGL